MVDETENIESLKIEIEEKNDIKMYKKKAQDIDFETCNESFYIYRHQY